MQETIFNIWTERHLQNLEKFNFRKMCNPCKSCNADGTLLGKIIQKMEKNL